FENGAARQLLPQSGGGRDCDGEEIDGLGPNSHRFPLDVERQSAILRLCSAHIPFTETSGGTHGKCAADTSGHTLRDRRRVSASGRAAPAVRCRTSENLQVALPEFGRPPGRNQTEEIEAPLQGRDGADCRAYCTHAGQFHPITTLSHAILS